MQLSCISEQDFSLLLKSEKIIQRAKQSKDQGSKTQLHVYTAAWYLILLIILAYLVFWGFAPLLSSTYLKLIQQKQADTRILAVQPLLTSHVFQGYKEIYSPNLQTDTFEVIQCHITTGDGDPSSPGSQGSCFCYQTAILYLSSLTQRLPCNFCL